MKTLEELYNEIIGSEELKTAFSQAVKENKLEDFLKVNGCEASVQEMEDFIKGMKEKENELTDEELDSVSGGGCDKVVDKSSTPYGANGMLVADVVDVCA